MRRKLCGTSKYLQVGMEPWTNTRKSTQGYQVQPKSMAEAIYRYEYGTENKSQQ